MNIKGSDVQPYLFLIPLFVFLSASISFLSRSYYSLYDFPLDDAWIHAVYSRSFAFFHGFQYNQGGQEAGATSPLWAIFSSPAQWFGSLRAEVIAIKVTGIGLGISLTYLVFNISEQITGSKIAATAAAILLALEPRFLFSALSGMETVLLVNLWLGALLCLLKRRYLLSLFLLSLMPVTRPEAFLILPFGILLFLLGTKKDRKPAHYLFLFGTLLPFALWSFFCKFVTGHYLTNAFYLKYHKFHFGIHEITGAWQAISLQGLNSLIIFPVGLIGFCLWLLKRETNLSVPSFIFMILGPIVYLFGVMGTREVLLHGYYWTRWTDPPSLLLTVDFCIGYSIILMQIDKLFKLYFNNINLTKAAYYLLLGLGITGIVLSSPQFVKSLNERRDRLSSDSEVVNNLTVQAGLWIDRNTPRDAIVGVCDAGAIRYFGNRYTIDLIGINNSDIVFNRKGILDTLKKTDYLVLVPAYYQIYSEYQKVIDTFQLITYFQVPPEKYTICDCPGQNLIVILKKR